MAHLRKYLLGGVAWLALSAASLASGAFFVGEPSEIFGWTAEYLTPQEFASKGNGRVKISVQVVTALDRVREAVGHTIYVFFAYRDPEHIPRSLELI